VAEAAALRHEELHGGAGLGSERAARLLPGPLLLQLPPRLLLLSLSSQPLQCT